MLKKLISTALCAAMLISCFSGMTFNSSAIAGVPNNVIVGYWHNFDNGSTTTKLADVHKDWDVLNVSFMETGSDRCTAIFTPDSAVYPSNAEAEFAADVKELQAKGKKVVISLGGQNGTISLGSTSQRDTFLKSSKALIDKYGFDGFDVDLEGSSITISGDTLAALKSPIQVNLNYILHDYVATYGDDFLITMAPEHPYVQGGSVGWAAPWGAYMPLLHHCRDILSWIHPQYYNNAIQYEGCAGYSADSLVYLSEMLINGFKCANGETFEGLDPSQVAFGVPAMQKAAGSGQLPISEYQTALKTLLQKYPSFRGVMTWSTNWDETNGNAFVTGMRNTIKTYGDSTIDPIPTVGAVTNLALKSATDNSVSVSWSAGKNAVSYNIYNGTKLVGNTKSTSYTVTGLAAGTTYSIGVESVGSDGSTSSKKSVNCKTTGTALVVAPVSNLEATSTTSSVTLNWNASTNGSSYNVYNGSTLLGNTNQTTYTVTGLNSATEYTFSVEAVHATTAVSDKVSVTVETQYNVTDIKEWVNGKKYSEGDKVVHNGKIYECLWETSSAEPGAYEWGPWGYVADYPSDIVAVNGITLYKNGAAVANNGSISVKSGDASLTFTAAVTPADAANKNYSISVNNSTVASSNGISVTINPSKATSDTSVVITAISDDGSYKASYTVNITYVSAPIETESDVFVFKIDNKNVYYYNQNLSIAIDGPATSLNGKTYVPFRSVAAAVGITDIKFNNGKITFTGFDGYNVEMTIDSASCRATKGSEILNLTIPAPTYVGGVAMLPVRETASLTGGSVVYDNRGYVVVSPDAIDSSKLSTYINAYK